MKNDYSIGIIDSGVGGLTVAKEIARLLPNENLIYLGDSKNCPYGNKTEDEIFSLTMKMIEYLKSKNVKAVVVACNTISTIVDRIRPHFDFPIISIVECAAEEIGKRKLSSVGLIATKFTVGTKAYDRLINSFLPECRVIGQGSEKLAGLIDSGEFEGEKVENEIISCMGKILEREKVGDLILGCTHYPIVENSFIKCCPAGMNIINPAFYQAKKLEAILLENGMTNPSGGNFVLNTTGDLENYFKIISLIGMKKPSVSKVTEL